MIVDPARESGCDLMSTETPPPPSPEPNPSAVTPTPTPSEAGLPPVLPPTGGQMLQLFVVPALIVLVLVGLFLLGPTLSGWFKPGRTADQFLRDLDSDNEEVRYRAASDLAQVLPRKEKRAEELARDVGLCLGLADRLAAALDASAEAEKAYAARFASMEDREKARDLKNLERDRNLITYLSASLGHVSVPVGVPLLGRMATQTDGMEPEALAERRRRALFALATLGERTAAYDKLDDAAKDEVEAALGESKDARAGAALAALKARRAGKPTAAGVVGVFQKTARDDDPYLRELTAFALNFWGGTPQEERAIDDVLTALANDAGVGSEKLAERQGRNPESKQGKAVTKTLGYNVRVNATLALARRGSLAVPREMLREMLSPEKLREVFVVEQDATPEQKRRFLFWTWTEEAVPAEKPNEPLVALTVGETLEALVKWHQKRPEADAKELMPLVLALEAGEDPALAAKAKRAREALTK